MDPGEPIKFNYAIDAQALSYWWLTSFTGLDVMMAWTCRHQYDCLTSTKLVEQGGCHNPSTQEAGAGGLPEIQRHPALQQQKYSVNLGESDQNY